MIPIYIFLTVIAVLVGIYSTLVAFVTIVSAINYPGSLEDIWDRARGIKKTYYWGKYALIAVICWAWVITMVVMKWFT